MNLYSIVMNSSFNPLRKLPKSVRLQIMVLLSWMWSSIFSLWVGSVLAFGASIGVHMILLVGIFFTAEAFRRARKIGDNQLLDDEQMSVGMTTTYQRVSQSDSA